MPVGITSPSKNLFLLGTSGSSVVANFFRKIEQLGNAGYWQPEPSSIAYDSSDENYIISGTADISSPSSRRYGWIEKRSNTGSSSWDQIVQGSSGQTVKISAMELKGNDLIVAGSSKPTTIGSSWTPWIAKYTNNGVIDWQSTSNTGDLEYTGIAIDNNDNYYVCGTTNPPVSSINKLAFIEKFDSSGNPGWGKGASMIGDGRNINLTGIATNSRGHVVAVGYLDDESVDKGYIVKLDTNSGEVLWDRTLESFLEIDPGSVGPHVHCNDVHIDSNDNIYVVATTEEVAEGFPKMVGNVIKYSPEGNIIWQNETDYTNFGMFEHVKVQADDETENVVVFGSLLTDIDSVNENTVVVSKYNKRGDLVFRRSIISNNLASPYWLDSDPSFYYILFITEFTSNNDGYTYGKVSSSGNGLGDFEYLDGQGNTLTYKIIDIEDRIGRLTDGSLQNSKSDLITYPFNANKIIFDDLATHVSNKKRQMDSADSFEYSGSPAIRPADFQELNLLGNNGIFVGNNLVQNGTFDSDTSNWEAYDEGVLSVSSGRLRVTSNDTISGFNYLGTANQFVPTEVGKGYRLTIDVIQGNDTARIRIDDDTYWQGSYYNQSGVTTGTITVDFIATTTTTSISLSPNSGTIGNYCEFDNVELKEIAWLDQSGKGNDGSVAGPTHNAAGYWEFDGTDDYIQLGFNTHFPEITLETWAYRNTNVGYDSLIGKYRGDPAEFPSQITSYELLFNNADGIRFHVTSSPIDYNPSGGLSTSTWYHIVGTYDGTTSKIFLNGIEVASGARTASINTVPWRIGASARNANYLDGRIGETRIYPRALTAAQVFQNYNATKSKYINEAPDTAPKIGPGIVYDNNLLLNYDFGNRATYDRAENLVAYSESVQDTWDGVFTSGLLDLINSTGTDNTAATPVGTNNAGTLTVDTTGGRASVVLPSTIGETKNQQITYSAYLKAKDSTTCRIDLVNATNTSTDYGYRAHATFDLAAGTVGSVTESSDTANTDTPSGSTASIQNIGGGWYRCSVTFTSYDGSNSLNATLSELRPNPGGSTGSVYAWGLQMERASTPGRYIKTSGSAITAPTTVKNLSSSSYNGELKGAVIIGGGFSYPTFNLDGYFDFDPADNQYIDTGLNAGSVTELTVEAWLRVDTYTNDGSGITIGDNSQGTGQCYLGRGNSGGDSMDWRFYTGTFLDETEFFTSDTGWKHYVGTYDQSGGSGSNQGRMRLYVDGNLEDTALSNNTSAIDFSSGANIRIGINTNGSSYFDGKYGEVRIYNRALTATEVSQNFNATRGKYGV